MSAGARRPAPESGLLRPYRDGRDPLRVPRRLTHDDGRRVDAYHSNGADRALVGPHPLAGRLTHGSASGTDTRCDCRSGRSGAQHAAAAGIGRHVDAWTQHAHVSDHAIVCRARIHDASLLGCDVPAAHTGSIRTRIVCVRGDL